jgi:chromosome segregation ATPase
MTRVLARLEAAEAERDTYKRGYEGREKAKQMWFKKAEERAREIESLQSSLSAIAKSADDTEKALEASHSLWRKHAENCGVDPEGLTEIGCLDLVEQEVASLQSSLSAETAARQQSEERARELALNLWHLATNNNPHRWTGHEGERWFDCYGVGNYLKDAIDHLYKLGVLEKLPAGHWYRLLPQEAETKEVKG